MFHTAKEASIVFESPPEEPSQLEEGGPTPGSSYVVNRQSCVDLLSRFSIFQACGKGARPSQARRRVRPSHSERVKLKK